MIGRLEAALLGAAATLSLCFAAPAIAADHRDAPTIDDFSAIDINDVFMFRDPSNCNPGPGCNLVMVLSTQAIADPSFGLTYHFQPNALYRFNFSTGADIAAGNPTAHIDFVFSPFENGQQTFRAFFPNTPEIDGSVTLGSNAATPNPPTIQQVTVPGGTISIFAGPREDPFFFDLVGFNRFIADFNAQTAPRTPHFNLFTGNDAFKGKNINAIAIEFPFSVLGLSGPAKLAAWAATSMGDPNDPSTLQQLDRMGNPGVNTTLINAPDKDLFNFGQPQNDATRFGPEIGANLVKYGVNQTVVLPILAVAAIPDTLKFDTAKPDGYLQVPPNGRQLSDRTTDFLLSLFFNVPGPPLSTKPHAGSQHPAGVSCPEIAVTGFSDCTRPKQYLSSFPFVGPPLQPPGKHDHDDRQDDR